VVVKMPASANFTASAVTCVSGMANNGSSVCPSTGLTIANLQGTTGIIIPSIPDGGTVTLAISGTVATAANYSLTNRTATVAASSGQTDPVTTNNSGTYKTTIHNLANGQNSVYEFSSIASAAASPAIAPGAGSFVLVYTLVSGPAVAGIGNSFTVPCTYSALTNRTANGVTYQWKYRGPLGGDYDPAFSLVPDEARLFSNLPSANRADQTITSSFRGDVFFRTRLSTNDIEPLGVFSIGIGAVPALPALSTAILKSSSISLYGSYSANTITEGSDIKYLWSSYVAPIAQPLSAGASQNTTLMAVPYNNAYPFRFTAVLRNGTTAPTAAAFASDIQWANIFNGTIEFWTPNTPPVAVDDYYTVPENGSIALLPLSNDTDADGHTLTISSINGTTLTPGTPQSIAVPNGTVTVAENGSITFTPSPAYHGTVSFPYTISDGNGGTSTAKETITVTPANAPPVAVDDVYVMVKNAGKILLPLPNDADPEGDPLTITHINGVALTPGIAQSIAVPNGTVTAAVNGSLTFTPDTDYLGTVTFPYTISDGNGGTAAANQVIMIVAAPLPVKLLDFTATKTTSSSTSLNWVTSVEQNNRGFAIQHSADGISWQRLAFVNSKALYGNSNNRLYYSFLHAQPVNGINYYRLQQTDADGRYENSDTRTLNFGITASLKVYPNPAAKWLMVEGLSNNNHSINIFDAGGKLVKTLRTTDSYKIDLTSLAPGIYNLIIRNTSGKIIAQHKIVKSSN
ncbi:MAG: T9SS type A sorting domain-containing protein, partial [Sphingobacteriales bacterium]